MIKATIKKILVKLYFGNSLFRKGVQFGDDSFIREHSKISGGKYITIGTHTRIYPYSRIECFDRISGETYSPQLSIGNNVLMGRNTTILCVNKVTIGDDCMFASNCFVSDENHGMDPSSGVRYEKQKLTTKPVVLGRNVWVGEKAIILPGVTVGDNAIIGAGSVVTKDVPANTIAVGNPAKVIKQYNFEKQSWEKSERSVM